MALGNRDANYSTYLSIYGGQIVREWRKAEPKPDQIPAGKELQTREISMGKNAGNTIWFVGFDYVAGMITNIELDDAGDFGARIVITLQDVDETYKLTLPLDSSYGNSFLFKMLNIDLSKEVSFEPWSMTKDEWFTLTKKVTKNGRSGLTIKQGEEKIENVYSREEPKGLPDLVVKETKKGTEYLSHDRDDFLSDRLDEFIAAVTKVNESGAPKARPTGNATNAPAPGEDNNEPEEEDDLPF